MLFLLNRPPQVSAPTAAGRPAAADAGDVQGEQGEAYEHDVGGREDVVGREVRGIDQERDEQHDRRNDSEHELSSSEVVVESECPQESCRHNFARRCEPGTGAGLRVPLARAEPPYTSPAGPDGAEPRVLPSSLSPPPGPRVPISPLLDRKSTRLNSSHPSISYAVFCLK